MLRALLPFLLTYVVIAGPPQEKATAPPASMPSQQAESQAKVALDGAATRMESSLEKQRTSIRKQASGWIMIGEPQQNETFLLPWPKPAVPATSVALRTYLDQLPCDPLPEPELERIVNDAAERQRVSPKLVRAMIAQESAGRPCAVSTAGAQGLMQLMPDVQRELAVDDPFDPRASVEAGVKLLRTLIDRYAGDVQKALAAYNAGPGAVDRAAGIPPIAETKDYVSKIVRKIE
jgi:hypothetical protein